MNAEKVQDIICDLWYLSDNAQGITAALYEMALCDDLMEPEDMSSHDENKELFRIAVYAAHDKEEREQQAKDGERE